MFSAVDYRRDPNVTNLTTRLRRHCILVHQKHLSHHSTAGDIRSPLPLAAHRQQQRGHVVTSRGHHVRFSQHDCLPLTESFHLSAMDRDCSVELVVVQASSPPLHTQCSARSSYSGRECMLQLPTTYRGVCLSITLFCSVPRPHACHGRCRTRNGRH